MPTVFAGLLPSSYLSVSTSSSALHLFDHLLLFVNLHSYTAGYNSEHGSQAVCDTQRGVFRRGVQGFENDGVA